MEFGWARIKSEGLKDEHALQAWLTRHMVEFLAKRGKRTIGWAEYLGAGVPREGVRFLRRDIPAAGRLWKIRENGLKA